MLFGRRNFGFGPMNMKGDCGCEKPKMECPIIEPAVNKCIEKDFYYEVPHICPVHTHIINRHIYKHTYTPEYTASEENQIINLDNGGCCGNNRN